MLKTVVNHVKYKQRLVNTNNSMIINHVSKWSFSSSSSSSSSNALKRRKRRPLRAPINVTENAANRIKEIIGDKDDIDGYIVPYHAHSDFIQLGAELGIVGFLLYLSIFILAVYYGLLILFKSELNSDKKWFVALLLISLGVYLIDANLNFPIARPQVLAPWALTVALISYYYNESTKIISNRKSNKIWSRYGMD